VITQKDIGRVTWNNCLVWALWQWYRHGGYLVIRRAGKRRQLWWPHFLWMEKEGGKLYHFTPVKLGFFPWPIFKGYVMEEDWKYPPNK
jgi:hypothetical protein